ncbi:helix-turn-helix transcriptional regulator [Clostridium sp. 19966]|uniref:helix-turn-helix domain-containing protein n=1 Tax=Clostridium sp. 19966 TaxID=2768166 RepID=UPI0028DF1B77|nr:helix-turn-helix transcriptional regulator [Clostridium sp. 19966]MDT8715761.1 helix-turn-helix transcriptional regulator [Clostridium sp. 19966]
MKYDKFVLCKRIKEIRLNRRKLYQDNSDKYEKYFCCTTQENFADSLHIDRRTIIKWEKGESIPPLDKLLDICNLVDCNIEYLLGADDMSEISPIAIASHYSKISSEIIRYGLENPDYLDCLNFFMHPDNCSELFNKFTLSAWKEFNANQSLKELKEPLTSTVIDAFSKFSAFTPINEYKKETYKKFLLSELPESKISFSSKNVKNKISIKACLILGRYNELSLSSESDHQYEDFINYLIEYTYEPLMNKAVLEIQQSRLASAFISLFSDYLSK